MNAILLTLLLASAKPAAKIGQCPAGYASEAGWCVPMQRDAPVAVPKGSEPCPSSMVQSGAYCVEKR